MSLPDPAGQPTEPLKETTPEVQMANADADTTAVEQPANGAVAPAAATTAAPAENTKTFSLPIARVKRIIKQDDEIAACSTSAVYAIASATVCVFYGSSEVRSANIGCRRCSCNTLQNRLCSGRALKRENECITTTLQRRYPV